MHTENINKIKILSIISVITIISLNAFQSHEAINSIDNNLDSFLWLLLDNLSFVSYASIYFAAGYYTYNSLSTSNSKTIFIKNIRFLLIPYLLWQFVIGVSKLLLLGQSLESLNFFETVFMFVPYAPDGPLVHIYILFFLSSFAILLYPIFKNKNISKIFILILSIFSYILYKDNAIVNALKEQYLFVSALYYLTAFLLGCYEGKNNKNDISMSIILIIISFILKDYYKNIFITVVYCSLPSILLKYIFPLSFLNKISKFSFLMFAIHPIAIFGVTSVTSRYIDSAFICNLLNISGVLLLSFVGAYILYFIIRKTLPTILPYLACIDD